MRRPELPPGPYLVIGLARSGQAAALALRARGEQVIGLDSSRPDGVGRIADAGVEVYLDAGNGDGAALTGRVAAIVKSPGVPPGEPAIARARELGLPVIGELELGWRLLDNEFVAVTGTNGKTTTVELIGHVYRIAGEPVAVAGNVGAALSGLVGEIDEHATVVCETSSFQLEDSSAFAPEVAVLLNIAPDHLDRHGTFAAYAEAKLRIFANQRAEDASILPGDLDVGPIPGEGKRLHVGAGGDRELPLLAGAARQVRFGEGVDCDLRLLDGWLRWRGEPLIAADELAIPGRHNLHNAMAAAAGCLVRGLDFEAVRAGLRSFPGVAHRLELVVERHGVRYVNDSKATNVASALVALDSLAPAPAAPNPSATGRPIHLIAGGQGKGQDFAPLRAAVERSCRAVYLIGEDAQPIAAALAGASAQIEMCQTLARAVELARARARAGETVLLSPACASFDQFADFQARGERFRELVEA